VMQKIAWEISWDAEHLYRRSVQWGAVKNQNVDDQPMPLERDQ
jgi:hypothetical protein